MVEITQVQWAAAVKYPGSYAILLAMRMAGFVMMAATAMPFLIVMMMVTAAMRTSLAFFPIMMMLMRLMGTVLMMMMVMSVVVIVVMPMMLFMRLVQFLNPPCRGGHGLEIKHTGIQEHVQIHVAEVARNNLGLRLYGVQYGTYASKFLGRNLVRLV
jgi:hypothetical protein